LSPILFLAGAREFRLRDDVPVHRPFLERALDQESECAAVLQQISAIRGAVSGLMAQGDRIGPAPGDCR
jgi:hypothetical protein